VSLSFFGHRLQLPTTKPRRSSKGNKAGALSHFCFLAGGKTARMIKLLKRKLPSVVPSELKQIELFD
jgi:hypothetical protein